MSHLFDDQKEYLLGAVLAAVAEEPGVTTSDLLLQLTLEAIYPVRPKGSPTPAPEPFVPDPSDVINALQKLLLGDQLIMLGRGPTLDRQKYRIA